MPATHTSEEVVGLREKQLVAVESRDSMWLEKPSNTHKMQNRWPAGLTLKFVPAPLKLPAPQLVL